MLTTVLVTLAIVCISVTVGCLVTLAGLAAGEANDRKEEEEELNDDDDPPLSYESLKRFTTYFPKRYAQHKDLFDTLMEERKPK